MSILTDPLSDPAFVRGLIDVTAVAVVAGVIGTFIVLRGIGFVGDAVAHSIFPGVVTAFLIGANLLLGALVAGVATAALMGLLTANGRVRDNTAIGVIFTAAFALGVVIIANSTISADELEGILFGDPLTAGWGDVALTLAVGAGVVAVIALLWRMFVLASFDPTGARAMGLPVTALETLLLAMTALTVVVAFKAAGNILVIALLITPAATARLLTDRLLPTAALASALGVASGIAGAFIGYHAGTSIGGVIVLIATSAFAVVWLLEPRRGVVASLLARRARLLASEPESEAEIVLASPEIQAPHGAATEGGV
jgi:manganese/iron transport system permease protein